ncbi:MAG TPA: copper resistance CopC family protein [Hyphomicrobium sp.]
MRPLRSALFAAAAVVAGALAAFAHAKMKTSAPADGATVPAGLSEIEMRFSHPMRLTLVRVHRADDDHDVALKGALPKTFADAANVAIDALTAGAYDVSWTAVSEDGHVMKGHFGFTVSGAAAPAP